MKQCNLRRNEILRFKRFERKSFSAFHSIGKVINVGALVGTTLSAAYVSTASAQNVVSSAQTEQKHEQELEEVTVTASKVATPLAQTARVVSVITQQELSRVPARSLQDLLVYAAGIDVAQRGGHGVQADISIRGGSFDENLILLNGINISSAQTGHLSYDVPVNLSDIERIEIIHGPSALIYGPGAFSGGINIITKKNAAERIYAQIQAGAHSSLSTETRLSHQTGTLVHSLSASHKSSAGYRPNTDYKLLNALWQTRWAPQDHTKWDLQLGYSDKAFGANSFYSALSAKQYERSSNMIASIRGELQSGAFTFVPTLSWQRSFDDYEWTRGTALNHHRADNIGAGLATTLRSRLGTTSLGIEYRREDIIGNKLGAPISRHGEWYDHYATRTNLSASIEHNLVVGDFALSAGALINHNTQRKGKADLSPALSATYRPTERLAFSATWSRSLRIPTFTDLYYVSPAQQGNANLKPEHGEAFELALRYHASWINTYATGFVQRGRDMIDWVKLDPQDSKFVSYNHSQLDTYGIEAGLHLQLGRLCPTLGKISALRVDYARLWQKHSTNGVISLYAQRYLRDKLTAKLDHPILRPLSATWQLRWQHRMGVYESGKDATGTKLYSSYPNVLTIDARLCYKVTQELDLHLSANNLTNRHYFDYAAVEQPGIWLSVGATYRLR